MSVVKADRFTALKAKVKAEMLRRNQSGSVAAYGGSEYDYAQPPEKGGLVRSEHREKVITPMRAVNSDLVDEVQGAAIGEEELADMETRVDVWAARSITDRSGSDCKSGCTGTCYTGCTTGCSGCGSGCPTGCSGCGSGCPTGCSGCGSGCPTGCSGCGSGCGDACAGCGTGCYGGCLGCGGNCSACGGGCGAECSVGCASCSVSCSSACDYKCSASCQGIAAGS